MLLAAFDAFRNEVDTLQDIISRYDKRTIRDNILRERFRTLFRTWATIVNPEINQFIENKSISLKLHAELEALAKLTSKIKHVSDYRKRLNRATEFLSSIVLYLPPSTSKNITTRLTGRDELFVSGIPDVSIRFVPNSLIGWKSTIESFITKYPFDRSVFIMIRYRKRNETVLNCIKEKLSHYGFTGILASEHNLTDDLYNPVACLLCCARGLAVFDRPDKNQVFNPNVAYELGMLHLLGRECKILKHHSIKTLQTDVLMKLYSPYKCKKDVIKLIDDWLGDDES
jgi:hypothetical protein